MLEALRDRSHEVITGVAVRADGVVRTALRRSTVRMRAYEESEIEAYVASGDGLDKAGAYGIQDDRFRPVEAIDGCWCNVMGLPLWTAVRALDAVGLPRPATTRSGRSRAARRARWRRRRSA